MRLVRDGAGRPIVFLHAALQDHRSFDPVIARRPSDVEAWLFDLPDHVEDEPTFDLARTEEAVLSALRDVPGPFTLVAHSFGSYLAARAMGSIADRVERAVLLGGFGSMPVEMAAAFHGLADAGTSGAVDVHAALRDAVDASLGSGVAEPRRAAVHAIVAAWPAARVVRCLRRVAEIADASPTKSWSVPTVLVHAKDDASVPIALGRELSALGANTELRELEGGGHELCSSESELVASLAFGGGR